MIARSFRPVGWVAAIGAAALGCYMLSLRVAAERADLDRLDARIIAVSQSIRSLQTELGTRGRMQQLEAWNDEVLALSAPAAVQFVEGGVSLARFDVRETPGPVEAEVRLAAAETPALPAPAPVAAAPVRRAVAQPVAPPPVVRRASATLPSAAQPAATPARRPAPVREAAPQPPAPRKQAPRISEERGRTAAPIRTASAAPERTAAAAPRRPGILLDERTIRDLRSASRAERSGGTRD